MGIPYPDPLNTGQWADDELYDLHAPANAFNVGYLEAWETDESPSGYGYNPVGDETTANKSTDANTAGVQAYTSWQEGLDTITYNLTSLPQNASIVKDLQSGNATYAELSAAQQKGGWSGGAESSISAPGTSTAFKYGGPQGETPGAPGVAVSSKGVTGDIWDTITGFAGTPNGTGLGGSGIFGSGSTAGDAAAAPKAAASALSKSIFGPLVGWIEEGAADITFVGFGLILIVIGLLITFKSEGEDAAPVVAAAA